MNGLIKDFKVKTEELNEYFSFIEFIDNVETHKRERLTIQDNAIVRNDTVIKRELQKILRANSFLLLYNLVESSIRNAIIAVYDSIHDKNLSYDELSERLQEVWLSHKTKELQNKTNNVKNWLKELMKEVTVDNQVLLDKDSINISGNLDYDNINKIINTYGFFGSISGDKTTIKNAIDKVKKERNLLAHGNKTFCQSGEIITLGELKLIRDTIINYLDEILGNTKNYIHNERFKKNTQ
ncbi:MAE_28990/MAE_18760 family HEPN-like nuclease [Dysgonomonas mossii]|uniref:MAE_28990/MAE_18760 family HEPN-like nuclease n=1 Tax=Dysgonomonas mossii TaxID=163665 RepID=UPI00399696B0